jgi:hypothetical protein
VFTTASASAGALDPALDVHLVHAEFRDVGIRLHQQARLSLDLARHVLDAHAVALEHQLAESRTAPARRPVGLQAARHIGIGHPAHLRGDQELAALVSREGELAQVAPDRNFALLAVPACTAS